MIKVKFILLMATTLICHLGFGQDSLISPCSILDKTILLDPFQDRDGSNITDEIGPLNKVYRIQIYDDHFDFKEISVLQNLEEIKLHSPSSSSDYYDYDYDFKGLRKSNVKKFTLRYIISYKSQLQEGTRKGNSKKGFLFNKEFSQIKFLTLTNYDLRMDFLGKCKNLVYLDISENLELDFFPLIVGYLPKLEYLVVDDKYNNSPEMVFIKGVNPKLKIRFVAKKEIFVWNDFHDSLFLEYCQLATDTSAFQTSFSPINIVHDNEPLNGKVELFDSIGNLIEVRYYSDSKPDKCWIKYDSKGRPVTKSRLNRKGTVKYEFINEENEVLILKTGKKIKRR